MGLPLGRRVGAWCMKSPRSYPLYGQNPNSNKRNTQVLAVILNGGHQFLFSYMLCLGRPVSGALSERGPPALTLVGGNPTAEQVSGK